MMMYLLKVLAIYIISIALIRIMGKSTLAQVTPHDLVSIIFIVAIGTQPILTEDWKKALIGMIVVSVTHIFMGRLTLIRLFNHWIIGHPTLLIKHGKLIKENLKASRYSLVELLSAIRTGGYPNIKDIDYAILEPTGSISIIPKREKNFITPNDLKLPVEYPGLPMAVILEGQINERNLALIGKDKEWLLSQLKKQNIKEIQEIFYATINDNSEMIYVDYGEYQEDDSPAHK